MNSYSHNLETNKTYVIKVYPSNSFNEKLIHHYVGTFVKTSNKHNNDIYKLMIYEFKNFFEIYVLNNQPINNQPIETPKKIKIQFSPFMNISLHEVDEDADDYDDEESDEEDENEDDEVPLYYYYFDLKKI